MKAWMTTAAIVLSLTLASSSLAQCCMGKAASATANKDGQVKMVADEKSGCTAKGEGCSAACKSQCEKAMAHMPKMECHVADQVVNCPIKAEQLAKENHDAKITYVVAKKEYTDRSEALQAYATVLDDYLKTVTSVRYAVADQTVNCPIEAAALAKAKNGAVHYQVALVSFATQDDAEKAAKLAREAADNVKLKVLVDGKEVACATGKTCAKDGAAAGACCAKGKSEATAKADAKPERDAKVETVAQSGEKAGSCHGDGQAVAAGKHEYVVGEMKTCCAATAKVQLAVAKISAAHRAVAEYAAQHSDGKLASGGVSSADEAAN